MHFAADLDHRLAAWGTAAVLVVAHLGGVAIPSVRAAGGETAPPETPIEYERRALKRDPQLQSLYRQWRASLSEASTEASKWPQPKVRYRTFIDGWWLENAALRHRGIVAQTFPWPGVLDEAADPAEARAASIVHRFQTRVLEVVFEVRRLLIDVARIDALLTILEEQRAIYGDVVGIVEETMKTDAADYADLLRVNTAREQIADRIDALEADRETRIADLRELLDLAPGVELTIDVGGDLLNVDESVPKRDELVDAARKTHPSLEARRAMADARRERAEYARARRLPWPTLMLGLDSIPNRMMGSDFDRRLALMVDVSVPIPIFGAQYEHAEQRFEHERRAELSELEGHRRRLAEGIETAVTRIDEKVDRLKRYRQDLLPLASDATEQLLNKIETGERDVTDYLLSFEQELDLETNLVEFRATIATERARLERLTGGAFEAFPDRPSPEIDIRDARRTRDAHE
jgi:outer membrane protein TolC